MANEPRPRVKIMLTLRGSCYGDAENMLAALRHAVEKVSPHEPDRDDCIWCDLRRAIYKAEHEPRMDGL